jgi:hypothetical protein
MVTRPELIVQADPAELDTALDENDEPHVTGIQSLRVAVSNCVLGQNILSEQTASTTKHTFLSSR